jgi:VWFA-related protein
MSPSKALTVVSPNVLVLLLLIFPARAQQSGAVSSVPATQPQVQASPGTSASPTLFQTINLDSMNFRRLSPLRSRDGSFHVAINFFDERHLLLTYEGSDMVHRRRTCPRTHDDRIVHAVVVDTDSGKTLHRADWYLHDREQYLWPLASGKMLLRDGESLIELDQDLNQKPIFEHKDIFWAGVTPNAQQVIAGYAIDPEKQNDKPQARKYEIRLLDAQSLNVLSTIPLERPIPQHLTGQGYADVVLKNGWTWLVRFGPKGQPRRPITRVRSSCIPDLEISGQDTLLIGRCTTAQDRYVISSFSTGGQFLWRHRWPAMVNTPLISRSIDGSRFALSTVEVSKEANPIPAEAEETSHEVRQHKIEILNAATGTSILTLETQPAITVGGNVALSPDASKLAVLHNSQVELYRLPPMEKDEAAKLAALRAGTPGLLPPDAGTDPDEEPELATDEELSTKRLENFAAANLLPETSIPDNSALKPAATPDSAANNAPASEKPEMVIHSRAEAVTVDVLVTDSKGHPVSGLKPEDFSVTEDGTSQKINFFKEHSVIDTHLTPAPDYKRPSNVFSNVSNTTQPDSSTLILLDMLNTGPLDQNSAREALTKYIKKKPANESFALCVLDTTLHLVRGFTPDENQLLLAMNDKRSKPSAPVISQLDTSSIKFIRTATQKLDSPGDVTRSFAIAMAGLERSLEDEQLSQNDMRTYLTIHAFEELARYMAGVPGRKKVLWLSGAFPLGQFASAQGLDAGPFHQQRNFVRLVSKTMNLLASAHVSVYPVDIRGVQLNSVSDVAEERPFSQDLPNSPLTSPTGTGQQTVAGGSGLDANAMANTRNLANDHVVSPDGFIGRAQEDSSRRNSEHSAMDLVAEQTGGKAFYGSNDLTQAVRTVVEQGTDYYTISYTPMNHRYDGHFRKIRVKVAGHGYRIAHRSGYYAEDPSRPQEKTEAVLQSLSMAGMLHGAPESRQIPFQARVIPVGEPRTVDSAEVGIKNRLKSNPATIRLQHYSVDFAIPANSLRFVPQAEGSFRGNFRLLANSYDLDGQGLLQAASTATADLRPDRYRAVLSEGFRLRQEFDVPVNASFLRLGVADLVSSNIGTLELPLPVSIPKESSIARRSGGLPPIEPE